jgi:tetratricopeptide (TPR) repeat protein
VVLKAFRAAFPLLAGNSLFSQGNYAEAREKYDRAIRIHPDMPAAYCNRGVVRSALDDTAGALADLDRAIELDSTYAKAYGNRARIRLMELDVEGAIADADRATSLDIGYRGAFITLGLAYLHQGDLDKAEKQFETVLNLAPKSAEAYLGRGQVYFAREAYEKALAEFAAARRQKVRPAFEHQNMLGLALTAYALGNHQEAHELWDKLLEMEPKFCETDQVQDYVEKWMPVMAGAARDLLAARPDG